MLRLDHRAAVAAEASTDSMSRQLSAYSSRLCRALGSLLTLALQVLGLTRVALAHRDSYTPASPTPSPPSALLRA